MAKSRYNIKGTKDFLVATVVCVFLCLWSIRDAWFPTQKILKKHPISFAITNSVPGVIQTIPVKVGEEVQGKVVLATLSDKSYKQAEAAAVEALDAAKKSQSDDAVNERMAALLAARNNLKACTIYNTDFTLKTTHGEEALRGEILEIIATPATHVDAGETVMRIKPHDTFYAFNKSLAVLSFIGAIVCLLFHRIASS